jgi:hypothetical protein
MIKRLAVAIIAVAAMACGGTPGPAPATPTLVSVSGTGHGVIHGDSATFVFSPATTDATTGVTTIPSGSTVVFTVPYPTSIEAFIDGKPLTKVDPPNSNRYEYSAIITNPGSNPARWSMGVRSPYDVPFFKYGTRTGYVLTIVDVAGSQRSAPATVTYLNPMPFPPPMPITGSTTYRTDSPNGSANTTAGSCPGGGHEQAYTFCFRNANHNPYSAGTTACSESQALSLLSGQYPSSQYTSTSGVCH